MSEPLEFGAAISDLPPDKWHVVDHLFARSMNPVAVNQDATISNPEIWIHCDSPKCGRPGYWDPTKAHSTGPALSATEEDWRHNLVVYQCRHCKSKQKIYSFLVKRLKTGDGVIFKLGEYPHFGPPTPTKLLSLINADREFFMLGRRAEFQSMGIAAFAYYRRVVENQKDRLIDKIREVAVAVGSPQSLLEDLDRAKAEKRFTTAIDQIATAIPESLLLKGQNPLKLLHSALSSGLHSDSDADCLVLATDIRVVMAHMAEKLDAALAGSSELDESVGRLIKKHARKSASDA